MSQNDTIRLLIINDSQSEVERLLSMLQNAGKTTRAQHVPSVEGLEKLLNDQSWDLMIALEGSETADVKTAIRTIKKLDKDVPVIIQADIEDEAERNISLIEGLKAGARDVVVLDDDQHLLMVMSRELQSLDERRDRRSAERKLKETERNNQKLLDSSRDAIGFVEDGMFLYTNRSFGEMFGYEDPDDVLVMPVIDMIADTDQDKYVQFMKDFKMGESAGSQELTVKGLKEDGTEFDLTFNISHAVYDDESCSQLLVEGVGAAMVAANAPAAAGAAPAVSANVDPVTGLYNQRYMLDALASAIHDAAENDRYRSLYLVSIDRFDSLRQELGLANLDAMVASLGGFLKENTDDKSTLARLSDDEFLIMVPGIDSEQQIEQATALCNKVEAFVCQAGEKTVQLTVTVGIAPISESATNPDDIINRSHQAMDEARAEGTNGIGNRAKMYVPKIGGAGEDDVSNVLEVARHALKEEQFQVMFQPIVSLQGVEEEHYEVFVTLPPNESETDAETIDNTALFKAIESDKDFAIKLDRWIILEASKKLASHRQNGHNTKLVLNLTSASLQDASLGEWLGVALKAGGIPAESLIFQFTENDATNYLNNAKAFSESAAGLGCECSLKHFGCSLDPFKTLGHLGNVSWIKIDGSFTLDIQTNNEDPAALIELIGKINEAGKKSVIPKVENATMMATLWQAGAQFIQGHYLQAPHKEMDFEFDEDE